MVVVVDEVETEGDGRALLAVEDLACCSQEKGSGYCAALAYCCSQYCHLIHDYNKRECHFELVTKLLSKVTVQRLKLAVLDLLKA
ncbi:hypothetical protein POTOM_006643 [Populus tomentosa]|uniref:Uncharacterized protein n=1 Tax=Populus tomentosa TaxID=118781 RepID=A0A8X8DG12_POPTO|nr:hypothetical protein POTOM_006643 [Populus tomentosa]